MLNKLKPVIIIITIAGFVPRAYRILDEWRWGGGQRL